MTHAARSDILTLLSILKSNHGQGYFDTSHLPWASAVFTDAMKEPRHAAWGWCSLDGAWDAGTYGSKARRKPIDELEGDAVRNQLATGGKDAEFQSTLTIKASSSPSPRAGLELGGCQPS